MVWRNSITPSMSLVSMMYFARMTAAPEMSSSLLLESVACRHKSQSAERDGTRGELYTCTPVLYSVHMYCTVYTRVSLQREMAREESEIINI